MVIISFVAMSFINKVLVLEFLKQFHLSIYCTVLIISNWAIAISLFLS